MDEEQLKKEARQRWKEMPFSNRFMFRLVMEKPELCKHTLELLMDCTIEKLEYLEAEKSLEAKLGSKGIRLDVFIKDSNGNAYDLEMQASDVDKAALGRRTRYYQSLVDINALKKGQLYSDLTDSVILFVCNFDPYGKNFTHYTFINKCVEDDAVELNDGTLKIMFNTTGDKTNINQDLSNFMEYVNTGVANDEFTNLLDAEVVTLRNDDGKAELFMTWEQEQLEAEAKGMLKEKVIIARKLKAKGMSVEDIKDITGLTNEEITKA